jgi:tetratricopeptide (TPR) repeat protein
VAAPGAASKDTLTRIIEMQPGTESAARAHYELGRLQLERGELEQAMQSFRQVPPHWPRWHSLAGLAIARIYETQIRDVDAAAREYRKVIRRHPESFASAECYSRMGDLYAALGDLISAENMRECAQRAYAKVMETSDDPQEREEAVGRFVTASRQLERWDAALEALLKARREAVKRKEVARRVEIDRQLGEIYLQREQHASALARFKDCLQHARRQGDLPDIVALTENVARCFQVLEDAPAVRRTWASLVDFVAKDAARMTEAARDVRIAPALVRAWLASDRGGEARKFRSRISRMTSPEARAALLLVDAELGAAPQ